MQVRALVRDLLDLPCRVLLLMPCLTKHSIGQLAALVKTRLERMQYRPGLLDGFLASTGLDLTPFCNPTIRDL